MSNLPEESTASLPSRGELVPARGPVLVGLVTPFGNENFEYEFPSGLTVAEQLQHLNLTEELWDCIDAVRVNDWAITQGQWCDVRPNDGTVIHIDMTPQGDIGRLLASVAVVLAAVFLGPIIGGALGFTSSSILVGQLTVFQAITSGLTGLGLFLVDRFFPLDQPSIGARQEQQRLRGLDLTNRSTPWDAVPRVFGRHRVFPLRVGLDYHVLDADNPIDLTAHSYLTFGYGTLKLSQLSIGEQPIETLASSQVSYSSHTGRAIGVAGNAGLDIALNMSVNLSALQGFAYTVWFRPRAAQQGSIRRVVDFASSAVVGLGITASNHLELYSGSASLGVGSAGWAMNPEHWFHAAVVYSSGTWSLYADGSLVGSASVSGNLPANLSRMALGQRLPGSQYFGGDFGEFLMFNRALDADEILRMSLAEVPAVLGEFVYMPVTVKGIPEAVTNLRESSRQARTGLVPDDVKVAWNASVEATVYRVTWSGTGVSGDKMVSGTTTTITDGKERVSSGSVSARPTTVNVYAVNSVGESAVTTITV